MKTTLYVTYLRDKVLLKVERNRSFSSAREPRHPNCTSAESLNAANRLSSFRSGHMMCLCQHVGRYCLRNKKYTFSLALIYYICVFTLLCRRNKTFRTSVIFLYAVLLLFYYLTFFGKSEISRIGSARNSIFFQ